jgi:formylglycine-generating enzyme required for sulfatase activity
MLNRLIVATLILLLFPVSTWAMSRDIKVVADLANISGATVGNYRALIIGINDYQDDAIPDLDTAVNDAKAMANVLQTHYGFRPENVSLLLNDQASSRNIVKQLRQMITKANPDDSIFIYYAGHGELDKVTNKGYWVPYEARGGDPSSYLSNSDIRDYIQAMKSRHVLLVADSCFSGSLFGKARSLPPINDKFYATLYKEKSRWGMTSGNLTPVSDGGSGGHSIFAYHFLKKLKENENPYLTPREIYQWIAPVVANNSEQLPITKPIRNTGDEGGEFVFIRMASLTPKPSNIPEPPPMQVPSEPAPLVLQGHLQINVNASNSKISINGQSKGTANPSQPLSLRNLPTGSMRIRVNAEGYDPIEKTVTINRNEWTQEVFELSRIKVVSLPPPTPPKTKSSGKCPSKMSFIPGGVFLAGRRDEFLNPIKDMSIDALCMDQYEVTQADYERVMGTNPSQFIGGNRPVEKVTWHEAKAYCEKVGKHLPTEWEWEKAAKAGTTTKYYWGIEVGSNNANCDGCGSRWDGKETAPVGSFAANSFGLHDMSGNVWEWTDSDDISSSRKVLRGGSWDYIPHGIRPVFRLRIEPTRRDNDFGFRCSQ